MAVPVVFAVIYTISEIVPPSGDLYEAAGGGDSIEVARLLRLGADPNESYYGDSSYLMIEHYQGAKPLHFALQGLDVTLGWKVLVQVSGNYDDDARQHYANEIRAYHDTIAALIEHGADVNAKVDNAEGFRPLHYAARAPCSIVELLRRAGADINARNNAGTSAITYVSDDLDYVTLRKCWGKG